MKKRRLLAFCAFLPLVVALLLTSWIAWCFEIGARLSHGAVLQLARLGYVIDAKFLGQQ